MIETVEVEKCPFCGRNAIVKELYDGRVQEVHMGARETDCILDILDMHCPLDEAVRKWNTRAPQERME